MKTIIKTTGFLLSIILFTSANSTGVNVGGAILGSLSDSTTELSFNIRGTGGGTAQKNDPTDATKPNVVFNVNLQGFELTGGVVGDITGLSTYFTPEYVDGAIPVVRLLQVAPYPSGTLVAVTIPVTRTTPAPANGKIGYFIDPEVNNPVFDTSSEPADPNISLGVLKPPTGGGGANPPNYSIGMEIASGGNNLGASESKTLPLNIIVTETANAANTAGNNVVVALAKDSRITSFGTNCGGTDWSLDSTTSSVAYLFTYTANSNAFPANTPSTIVCPVTVTRPTTQSGKLQLNAVLRHGSGDTKTSNDVASIEVTYN